MQFISCHNGQIFTDATAPWQTPNSSLSSKRGVLQTGLAAIDELLPKQGFSRGAIHEILWAPRRHGTPMFFALLIAKSARSAIVWCDPCRTLYPPAVAGAGVPMERLFLLHPKDQMEQAWAVTECMRCRGVGATVAQVNRLSRIEARRLQLAAEKGGGIGLLLRPLDRNACIYAAASRWLVCPHPGLRTVQRWKVQLIHAHGGRVGQTVILEHHRETHLVRAVEQLGDRQAEETMETVRASA